MKKIVMLLLALVVCFSLVACGKDEVENNDVNANVSGEVSGDVESEVSGDVETDVSGEIVEDPAVTPDEPVVTPDEPVENPDEPVENPDEYVDPMMTSAAMKALVDELNTKANVQINAPFDMKIDREAAWSDIGLEAEVFDAKIADSVKSESMMMPSNHSLCIVEVKAGEDVASVKDAIFKNADPRKWICANADKVMVVDSGNIVMLVMSTEENCTNLYNAFADHFGAANVGAKLERLFGE
ncbi:MAG: hypothetical protein IJO08_00810 [Clostridia bacterium]|nr:hypothetical protein [Clostridia bacterium]